MASIINRGLAQSLIQEFRTQNRTLGDNAWKTPDGQQVNGYFIDRESLESILKDEKIAGIHVYFAKHANFKDDSSNVQSLIVTGSQLNTNPGATTPYIAAGDIFDAYPPCPPFCTDL